jgi:hypothetical protein
VTIIRAHDLDRDHHAEPKTVSRIVTPRTLTAQTPLAVLTVLTALIALTALTVTAAVLGSACLLYK